MGLTSLIEAVRDFDAEACSWDIEAKRLEDLTNKFDNCMARVLSGKRTRRISATGEAGELWGHISKTIQETIAQCRRRWEEKAPVRELSKQFQDRLVLLIYGKVNAGKSTLINYLAEVMAQKLGSPRFFVMQEGEERDIQGPLETGEIETTSRIQGVKLGERLVLLDTPGLHSVTKENHQLAERFTEAADVVLWLSSSAAPGTVTELDQLKEEIKRQRPLLPVITQSDYLDEDIDENENIVSRLCNKSDDDRREQEQDVACRAKEKLGKKGSKLLIAPVSISVHAAQDADTEEVAAGSGMDRLYKELVSLVEKAKRRKGKKAREQIVEHLQHWVIDKLKKDVLPQIQRMRKLSGNAQRDLQTKARLIGDRLRAELRADARNLVLRHAKQADRKTLADDLSKKIQEAMIREVKDELKEYMESMDEILSALRVDVDEQELGEYEQITSEYIEREGEWKRAASASVGAAGGAAIGASLGGPAGLIIGGIIGYFVGDKAGDALVEEVEHVHHVSTDPTKVEQKAADWIDRNVPSMVNKIITRIEQALKEIVDGAGKVEAEIERFANEVKKLKEGII